MNGDPNYPIGIKDERSRCKMITELWKTSAYINIRYGEINEDGMKILLRVVALIQEDIESGKLPGRS